MTFSPDGLVAIGLSDPGKIREGNEDAFGISADGDVIIVADGIGGANAGATASRIVVELLPKMITRLVASHPPASPEEIEFAVRDAFVELSTQVRERSMRHPGLAGMGATVVLGFLRLDRLIVAHMGDTRAYLYRAGTLHLLTEDHSVVGILTRRGEITPEEAPRHPARGRVSRFMGMEGVVFPDVRSLSLDPGDRILLCTDGLTGMVDDHSLAGILAGGAPLSATCRSLVDAANAAGGRDNVTVLLAEWRGAAGGTSP